MEVDELMRVPVRSGDLLIVKLDFAGTPAGALETTVAGIDSALAAAVAATGAERVGLAVLDKGVNVEHFDAERLAALLREAEERAAAVEVSR